MKIYCMSVIAFRLEENDNGIEIGMVYHAPAMIRAYSIEEAADNAKNFAFNNWKETDGFYGHQVAVTLVTKEFYNLAGEVMRAGVVNMAQNEADQVFVFDAGLEAEFIA